MASVDEICATAKRRLQPTSHERLIVERTSEEIQSAVENQCRKAGLAADVRVEGSVAKDTWIREYVDIDIFMLVSPELTKEQLADVCLPIARRAMRGHRIIERFAEHPYVEAFVKKNREELRVNVVPCYKVERGNWLSATDRSPFHTRYIREHMPNEMRDEVRLLKAFLRSTGTYGADIKTGGFSGMLAETLVLGFNGFINTARNLAEWNEDCYLDVERYYENRADEIRKIFREPLVVIDPIDKGRNLGAAVRAEQLWNLVAASRHFLKKPSARFFTAPRIKPLTLTEYRRKVAGLGSGLLCLSFGKIDVVVDILWSQLYRTQRALSNFLTTNDFQIIRSAGWSDEKTINVILFELETLRIPRSRRHEGPPVSRAMESASFVTKHDGGLSTVSGPWIENRRWVVQKLRGNVDAEHLLNSALKSRASTIGIAPVFTKALKRKVVVLNERTLEPMIADADFSRFMRSFLAGRPIWFA